MNFLTSAEKIRKLRKELGMSQKDLSADGITRPFISLIESGKRSMSYNTAKSWRKNLIIKLKNWGSH